MNSASGEHRMFDPHNHLRAGLFVVERAVTAAAALAARASSAAAARRRRSGCGGGGGDCGGPWGGISYILDLGELAPPESWADRAWNRFGWADLPWDDDDVDDECQSAADAAAAVKKAAAAAAAAATTTPGFAVGVGGGTDGLTDDADDYDENALDGGGSLGGGVAAARLARTRGPRLSEHAALRSDTPMGTLKATFRAMQARRRAPWFCFPCAQWAGLRHHVLLVDRRWWHRGPRPRSGCWGHPSRGVVHRQSVIVRCCDRDLDRPGRSIDFDPAAACPHSQDHYPESLRAVYFVNAPLKVRSIRSRTARGV